MPFRRLPTEIKFDPAVKYFGVPEANDRVPGFVAYEPSLEPRQNKPIRDAATARARLQYAVTEATVMRKMDRIAYGLGPKPGLPDGLDPSNAQVYYAVHPRESDQTGYMAEHARWAQREALTALHLAAQDATAATEAASRANTAALAALREPPAPPPVYSERPLPGEPFVARPRSSRPDAMGRWRFEPEWPRGSLRTLLRWFQLHPGPPVMPELQPLIVSHGRGDVDYLEWKANSGDRKSLENLRRWRDMDEWRKARGLGPQERGQRQTRIPEVPPQPPVPFLQTVTLDDSRELASDWAPLAPQPPPAPAAAAPAATSPRVVAASAPAASAALPKVATAAAPATVAAIASANCLGFAPPCGSLPRGAAQVCSSRGGASLASARRAKCGRVAGFMARRDGGRGATFL